jgi:molybdate transport system ATP-binding protein
VIEEGRLIHDGPPAEVVKTPTSVTLAALCGTENVLTGVVAEHRVAEDVTELRVGEVVLRVPLCRGEVGGAAVVAVRPEDILLSLEHVSGTSARNQLPGRIVEVECDRLPIVKVQVDGGPVLRARITRGSLERLGLEPGLRLHLLIKTWAFHPVDVGSPVAAGGF